MCCSGAAWPRTAHPARLHAPVRHERRPAERLDVPEQLHLDAAARRAVPDGALRPVHAAQPDHGHREHLRAGGAPALQRRRVGAQHPLLPRPPDHRPGGAAAAQLERTVRVERGAELDAAARGAAAGGRRAARVAHGGRPRGGVHGPHPHLPGAGGEVEGAARRLGRVLLPQGHRRLLVRYVIVIAVSSPYRPRVVTSIVSVSS